MKSWKITKWPTIMPVNAKHGEKLVFIGEIEHSKPPSSEGALALPHYDSPTN